MERSLQNIVLEEKGESLTYIPRNSGGGELNYPPRASRKAHASYLQNQLKNAWNSAQSETKNVVATLLSGILNVSATAQSLQIKISI